MKDFRRIFGVPILIAALTVFGLVIALWGGAGWRWASWLALVAPLTIVVLRLFAGDRTRSCVDAKGQGR